MLPHFPSITGIVDSPLNLHIARVCDISVRHEVAYEPATVFRSLVVSVPAMGHPRETRTHPGREAVHHWHGEIEQNQVE
jgi:hypothetical protein